MSLLLWTICSKIRNRKTNKKTHVVWARELRSWVRWLLQSLTYLHFCLKAWLRIKGVKSDCHWNLEETLHEIAVSIPLFGSRGGQSAFLSPAVVGLHLSVQVRVRLAEAEVTKLEEATGLPWCWEAQPCGAGAQCSLSETKVLDWACGRSGSSWINTWSA